jgi:xanthine dehydrogenase iron-sulfur cluster and FAD-binding subunit A
MAALRKEVRPIDDLRSTAEYRQRVTENLVRRFWTETA